MGLAEYNEEQLREIDSLVAEKAMGWIAVWDSWDDEPFEKYWFGGDRLLADDWCPTRKRDHAMMVFEKCKEWMILRWDRNSCGGDKGKEGWWDVRLGPRYQAGEIAHEWDDGFDWFCPADTPMLAICLAALKKAG